LREASLIHGAEDSDRTVPHDEFAEFSRRVFATWKKRLFGHPLWRGLVDGNAPAAQFAGWLMENYHFIEGVNDRLGSATAYCRSRQARRHFARHYREEYDHGEFFIQALLALGFTRDAVYASRPLASTRGIIDHMRRCARQDSLFYAACSGFLYGLTTAAHLVAAGTHNKVLVIGSDTMSRIIDYTDRSTCVLFGDGAGAGCAAIPVCGGGHSIRTSEATNT
jgi:hypothetical protein